MWISSTTFGLVNVCSFGVALSSTDGIFLFFLRAHAYAYTQAQQQQSSSHVEKPTNPSGARIWLDHGVAATANGSLACTLARVVQVHWYDRRACHTVNCNTMTFFYFSLGFETTRNLVVHLTPPPSPSPSPSSKVGMQPASQSLIRFPSSILPPPEQNP